MNKRNLFLIFGFLILIILFASFSYAAYSTSNFKYTYGGVQSAFGPRINSAFDPAMCQEGQDFIFQIDAAGCTPSVVRSDLLEEQDVPVFCPIQATKINPLINVDLIHSMTFGAQVSPDVRTVSYYPANAALSSREELVNDPTYSNVGYVVIFLRNQPNESAMPEFVEGNLTANLVYDVENAFGIRENTFYLHTMDQDEWLSNMNRYSFWNGKGYLRAENVNADSASIKIYSDVYNTPFEGNTQDKSEFGTIALTKGETSELLYLPGFYCFAGLKLRLDDIEFASTKALLKINSEYLEIKDGEKFLDGRCQLVKGSIEKDGITKKVKVYCQEDTGGFFGGNNIPLSIAPKLKLKVDGKEIVASVGDKLYESKNGYVVFLSYAKLINPDAKGKKLRIYLVAKPKKEVGARTTLTNDEMGLEADLAEAFEWEDTGGKEGAVGMVFELASSAWGRGVKTFREVFKGDYHKILTEGDGGDNFEDIDVILLGFDEGHDLDIFAEEDLLAKYYSLAKDNYEIVIDGYRGFSYPENESITLDERSLQRYISLAAFIEQEGELKTLCIKYSDYFPKSELPSDCKRIQNLQDAGSKIEEVLIDGKVIEISLIDISESNYRNYGVELLVQDDKGNSQSLPLTKNKPFYLNSLGFNSFSNIFEISQKNPVGIGPVGGFNYVYLRYDFNKNNGDGAWEWSPDKITWMGCGTTTVTEGTYKDKTPSNVNAILINNLKRLNYEFGKPYIPIDATQYKGDFVELTKIVSHEKAEIRIGADKNEFLERASDLGTGDYRTLEKGITQSFGTQYTFTIKNINLEEYARVSIIPTKNNQRTSTDFKFKIFIEKRGIKLSPEKIQEKIDNLNKTIEQWTKISDGLGGVVKTMKKACVGTSAVLTVKNLIGNSGGKSMARTEVMKADGGWSEKCFEWVGEKDSKYKSVDECYLDHAEDIEAEVNALHDLLKKQNTNIEQLQEGCMDEPELLESRSVDTDCLAKALTNSIILKMKDENITNPKNLNENISLIKIKTILTDDSWKNGFYSLDDLKDIDLYYDLWQDAKNSEDEIKYRSRLYPILYSINKNSQERVRLLEAKALAESKGVVGVDFIPFSEKGSSTWIYQGKQITSTLGDIGYGENIQGISYNKIEYYVTLKSLGGNKYQSVEVYGLNGYLLNDPDLRDEILDKFDVFEKRDATSYQNRYLNPIVRYYDTEPYKGQPALVPFDRNNGWYVYVRQTLGVGGSIASYDLSGVVNSFVLCNVGVNGIAEYPASNIDDICEVINTRTGQAYNQFPGLDEKESSDLIKKAVEALEQAQDPTKSKKIGDKISILRDSFKIDTPATDVPLVDCADFMSVKDCQILFNVCDPVVCPNSRCDFGGKYPVKDVIQSGIIGSLALCLPNFKEGIYIPVCLSGVKAGMDSWISISQSYQDCLQQNLDTGETVGICDELHSVYMCDFFWRQALPITKLIFPKFLEVLTGESTVRGGGEYMFVQSALDTAQASIDYLTQNYAESSYKAFKFRNSEEVGTAVCKNFISVTYPGGVDILDTLTDPDSPPQFTGKFDEIPFSTVTNPPISQYKVYYHIYAGTDRGAYYQVYIKDATENLYYQDNNYGRNVASGYIVKGEYASETKDFTSPSGMNQLCINVNGQVECGFGQVSTEFAVDWLKDQYIARQAEQTGITTEKACISGTTDWYNALNPNIQEGAGDLIDPQIYNDGLIRICSTQNPGNNIGEGQRWVDMGYCGDEDMRCWLDQDSVKRAVEFGYTADQILNNTGQTLINQLLNSTEHNYFKDGEFEAEISLIQKEKSSEEKIKKLEGIFDRIFYMNEKAYVFYLIAETYSEITRKGFNRIKGLEDDSQKPSCEDLARLKIINFLKDLEGQPATRADEVEGGVVPDCDGNGVINCYDVARYAYDVSGLILPPVYSDDEGKDYSIKTADLTIDIKTSSKTDDPFFVNPNFPIVGLNEDEKLNLLKPGYMISYYWGGSSAHNAIFVGWKDIALRKAILFDGNGRVGASDEDRIFRYFESSLSDSEHPVFIIWKPALTKDEEILGCGCFDDQGNSGYCASVIDKDCEEFVTGACPGDDTIKCCIKKKEPFVGPLEPDFYSKDILEYFLGSGFVSASMELNDGAIGGDMFFQYSNGNWKIKKDANDNWNVVGNYELDTLNIANPQYWKPFIENFKTKKDDYFGGMNLLIKAVVYDETARGFFGSDPNLVREDERITLDREDSIFTVKTKIESIPEIYFSYVGNTWKWAYTKPYVWIDLEDKTTEVLSSSKYDFSRTEIPKSGLFSGDRYPTPSGVEIQYTLDAVSDLSEEILSLMEILKYQNLEFGAGILFNLENVVDYMKKNPSENIITPSSVSKSEKCSTTSECQTLVGNVLYEYVQSLKSNYPEFSDADILRDTGYVSLECLALGIAFQESSLSVCDPISENQNAFYCEGDFNKVFSNKKGTDIGVMQINVGDNPQIVFTATPEIWTFEGNIDRAMKLISEKYGFMEKDNGGKTYACNNNVVYSGWKSVLRYYNGWNTDCSKRDVNYVENVLGQRETIENMFPQCSSSNANVVPSSNPTPNPTPGPIVDGFIYVPSIGLYVAKNVSLKGKNWNEAQEALHNENSRMLTVLEFREFLKYTKEYFPEIYLEITDLKDLWRAEWLDAEFKVENKDLFVYYYVFENNKIIRKKEKLDEDTLRLDKTPGILLENWLKDSTKQGLPKKDIKNGDLYYWNPENGKVAVFSADDGGAVLYCYWNPSYLGSSLGVRAVKLTLDENPTPGPTVFTLNEAMYKVYDMQGKYSETANKEFIDALCNQSGTSNEVLTQDQCNDIKGKGSWFGASWIKLEEDMAFVKRLLIAKSKIENSKKWNLYSALLNTNILGEDTPENRGKGSSARNTIFNTFVDELFKDGVLNEKEYKEYTDLRLGTSGNLNIGDSWEDYAMLIKDLEIYLGDEIEGVSNVPGDQSSQNSGESCTIPEPAAGITALSDPRERVMKVAQDSVGTVVGSNCWTSAEEIYLKASVNYQCIYTEGYSVVKSQPKCTSCGCKMSQSGACYDCERENRKDLIQGDLIQIYNQNTVSTTGGHNLIFDSWANKNKNLANVYHSSGGGKPLVYAKNYDLTNSPVTVIWKPVLA